MFPFSSSKHAEHILEDAVKLNPYFPFTRIDNENLQTPVYVFSVRYKKFYLSLLLVGVSGLFTLIWPTLGENVQYCMFSALVFAMSGFHALEYYPLRTIVHDPAARHFTVYRGRRIISCKPVTDLCIKMVANQIGSKGLKYHLVLDGNGLELPIPFSGETSNKKKLRSLGHKLANKLDMNYFDIHVTSRHPDLIKQERQ